MKTLKQYIKESLLDDEEELGDLGENIKDIIKQFLKDNYDGNFQYEISGEPDEDGKYIVDCKGSVRVLNKKIVDLTNEHFVFGEVTGDFYCSYCSSLTSFDGAPKEVGGDFYCSYCSSLTSLKGAPKKVDGEFNCRYCSSLTSLNGAPKIVDGSFHCSRCKKQFTKEDVLKVSKVKGSIYTSVFDDI